jgi:hypothetical protein
MVIGRVQAQKRVRRFLPWRIPRPHEDLNVGGLFVWASAPALKAAKEYLKSVKKYPNSPAERLTKF